MCYPWISFLGQPYKVHKRGGLKKQKLVISQFRRVKAGNQGVNKALLPLRLGAESFRRPSLVVAVDPWRRGVGWLALLQSLPLFTWCFYLHIISKAPAALDGAHPTPA